MRFNTLALCLVLWCISMGSQAQNVPAYAFFNEKGKATDYSELLKAASKADVVLFGELHDNAIVHWLQSQLTQDLYDKEPNLVLGAEMFETDDQLLIDEYLQGIIREKDFEKEVKLWDNYSTDYKALMTFAEEQNLQFVGTNVPRRYAALVGRKGLSGLESVSEEAKAMLAPLPFEIDYTLPSYKAMIDMMAGHGMGDMDPKWFVAAQALKDATMAHHILKYWEKNSTFLHFHGTYHSQFFEGITWYLMQSNPKLKIVTIHSVEQEDLSTLEAEYVGSGSFVLVAPTNMTKSYHGN